MEARAHGYSGDFLPDDTPGALGAVQQAEGVPERAAGKACSGWRADALAARCCLRHPAGVSGTNLATGQRAEHGREARLLRDSVPGAVATQDYCGPARRLRLRTLLPHRRENVVHDQAQDSLRFIIRMKRRVQCRGSDYDEAKIWDEKNVLTPVTPGEHHGVTSDGR